ncbi:MAG: protease complex subunit PrcB family protein [Gemmatimonadetes bacterium]|nr:MAG: protease complex subunit PrcB family protein [Gemmatimonadota bacterium]
MTHRAPTAPAWLLLALPLVCGCATDPGGVPEADETVEVAFERPYWGRWDGGPHDSLRTVVRDSVSWREYWIGLSVRPEQHPTAPEIDFSRRMVIAASMGLRPTLGHRIDIDGIRREGDELVVDVTSTYPDDGCRQPRVQIAPVHMVLVPASSLPVRFRESPTQAC